MRLHQSSFVGFDFNSLGLRSGFEKILRWLQMTNLSLEKNFWLFDLLSDTNGKCSSIEGGAQ